MKLSTQEEYGLRCLLQLARADREAGLTVKEIALREGLSTAYVEKLLRLLGKAELIHSVRGIKGGYLLSKKTHEITLGAVVRALGSLPNTEEICDRFTGNLKSCIHIDDCCVRAAWTTLTQAIDSFLDQTKLSDLVGTEKPQRGADHAGVFLRGAFPPWHAHLLRAQRLPRCDIDARAE